MRNIIFCFGDTFWKQNNSTAMGMPPEPPYTTIYYRIHEITFLPQFQHNIRFYCQYIDDVFGIWITSSSSPFPSLPPDFKKIMNSLGQLLWEFKEHSKTIPFLDLKIRIHGHKIKTNLFEKPLNFHLCLPPHSSHPKMILKRMITEMIKRISDLTSNPNKVLPQVSKFYYQLCNLGYPSSTLLPLIQSAFTKIQDNPLHLSQASSKAHIIYLHLTFHPCDPHHQEIQKAFKSLLSQSNKKFTLSSYWNHEGISTHIDRLKIANHCPPNLKTYFFLNN